jgi:hypothetical protein
MPPRTRGGGGTSGSHGQGGHGGQGSGGQHGNQPGNQPGGQNSGGGGGPTRQHAPGGGSSGVTSSQTNLSSSASIVRPTPATPTGHPPGTAAPSTPGGVTGVNNAANSIGQNYHGSPATAQNVTQVRYENSGSPGAANGNPALDHPQPNTAYVVDGRHLYITDGQGRTVYMQTRIERPHVRSVPRDNARQGASGGSDRLARDDGMHLVGTQFSGPIEQINMSPGAVAMNRGNPGFAGHESAWATHARGGGTVDVVIEQTYPGTSVRPTTWDIRTRYDNGTWTPAVDEHNPAHSQPGRGTNRGYVPRH